MARPCTVCRHPERNDIDSALLNGGSLRSIAKQFRIGASALFRHKRDHIAKTLIKAVAVAEETREIIHGGDLLETVRGLNEKTLRILKQAETDGDSRTALAAIREARGNSELLCKMLIAVEAAKREEQSAVIDEAFLEEINALMEPKPGQKTDELNPPLTEEANSLAPQPDEIEEVWIERMVETSMQKVITE